MSNLVIVALPRKDDYVNKISSEKVPHLTLLFLGEDSREIKNLDRIIEFVEHAAKTSLRQFSLEVEKRDTLGDEKADVLIFSQTKYSGFQEVRDFRSNLLKNSNIKTAYDSTTQFPEWIPHLTLGYPETPAKVDNRDYPGINYVEFDRIAVWFGEYEGVDIPLSSRSFEDTLAHFGVKGMKWGVRKGTPSAVTVSDKRRRVKTSGGKRHPAHSDAVNARKLGQVGKKSGLKALSNQELQTYAHRLQLEQNVKRLNYNEMSRGKKFIATLTGKGANRLGDSTVNAGAAAMKSTYVRKRAAAGAAALALAM